MPRAFTFAIALLLVFAFCSSAGAADKVTCYTLWDDRFFYAGFEVQDPDVQGTNAAHMSNPWEDDSIEVFLETDGAASPNRTPNTFQMSGSAAGGSSFLIGENGIAAPKKIFTFKFAKRVQGTLNNSSDRDAGYIVELAIPWSELGGPPKSGQVMGFNVLCRMRGENTGFVSLSPQVVTEEDIQVPAKWAKIKFVDTPTIIARQDGAVVCRKVVLALPVINGTLGPGEWMREMRFQLTKPEPAVKTVKQVFPIERLALTHYFYWYQGDPRKEAPFSHVRYENGVSALMDHPLDGVGPWFSCDRVQWHKDQLAEISKSGIDVIIPVYWGDTVDKRGFASKGLICLVQAMKELKTEEKSFPLVGMFFDTSSMLQQYGARPDLKSDEVKETFYGMVKDFFIHVPDEFRASIQTPTEKGGYPGYIVVLYAGSFFSDFDASFVEHCNKRFAEDFGGRRLIWIGAADYRPKAAVMDGYSDYGAGLGPKRDATGWIDVAGIGAGYDDSAVQGRAPHQIRSRMGGNTFKKDWDALALNPPNWVILDGWNELHEGSDISPSMEYGDRYTFLTKLSMLRFNGMKAYDAKYLKHDTPTTMLPGAMYQVTLTIKNAGTKPWYPGAEGAYLTGRWFRDGVLYADTAIRLPLQNIVLVGNTFTKTIGIRAVDQDGKALPEGDYELRMEMLRRHDEWFANGGDTPLSVPVKVSASAAPGFTLVSSSMPTLAKSGATYNVTVKLRNDGPTAWKSGAAKVGYRILKASVHLGTDSEDAAEVVGANESALVLQADVEPGRVAEVAVPVAMLGSDGTPLPVWTQHDLWTNLVRWDVFDGTKWLASAGTGCAAEPITVAATDYGPKFVSGDTPAEMNAGKSCKVNLVLQNTGTDVWTKADFVVGYHWYYLDGMEAVWDGAKSRLRADVPPGQQAAVEALVTAPQLDGQYYLVWDLARGDKWASTTANTRGADIQVVRVNVVNGKLVAQDLSKLYDTDAISFDTNRKDGDADGAGHTLPGELLPPLLGGDPKATLWPCGLWTSASPDEAAGRISFKYPPKADGAKNAISCKGQTIEVKPGKYAAVHLLLFATEKTIGREFKATWRAAKASSDIQFAPWGEQPAGLMHPAFVCPHRHSPDGDLTDQPCYLAHYVLTGNPGQELVSITLPDNTAIKVMAITLEKAE